MYTLQRNGLQYYKLYKDFYSVKYKNIEIQDHFLNAHAI